MNLNEATHGAKRFIEDFQPYCRRIEVAGSVRRKKEDWIKDIEIVIVPDPVQAADLRNKLAKHGGRFPSAHTHFHYAGRQFDLYITTPEKWGCIFLIRTGSKEFSKAIVTLALKKDMKFHLGRLWRGSTLIETPEEADVFEALGLAWIEPVDRIGAREIAIAAGKG